MQLVACIRLSVHVCNAFLFHFVVLAKLVRSRCLGLWLVDRELDAQSGGLATARHFQLSTCLARELAHEALNLGQVSGPASGWACAQLRVLR